MIQRWVSFAVEVCTSDRSRLYQQFHRNLPFVSSRRQSAFGDGHQSKAPFISSHHDQQQHPHPNTLYVPPQYLYQTASPHVYVAACALDEMSMDPKSLFTDCVTSSNKIYKAASSPSQIPPSFRSCHFDYVSPKAFGHQLPTYNENESSPIPEVAILGKSNVGKSSLINALTRTKDLARTSKTPGRTQQVNYFAFVPNENQRDPSSMSHTSTSCAQKNTPPVAYLIDLPGYGYAEAPVDQVGRWQDTTQDFLQNRRDVGVLKRLYVLVDSRHGVSMSDRAVLGWLDDAEIPYCVVFTKADRIGRPMIIRYANDICMRYHSQFYNQNYVSETVNPSDGTCLVQGSQGCQSPLVHVTSSKTGQGIHELMWTMHWDLFDPTRLSTKIKVAIE